MSNTNIIPAAKFHFLTPVFDIFCALVGLGGKYRKNIIKNLALLNKRIKVLDAGCGTGSLAIDLKKLKPNLELYGVDADPKILSRAKEKTKRQRLTIQYIKAHIQKLPFPDEYFDVIYSSLVFHHLTTKAKQEAMAEIYRVLKKRGYFLLVDFGKPKNIIITIFSLFTILFEQGYDNYKGKIPEMLKKAKFKSIKKLYEYRYNIHFLLVTK